MLSWTSLSNCTVRYLRFVLADADLQLSCWWLLRTVANLICRHYEERVEGHERRPQPYLEYYFVALWLSRTTSRLERVLSVVCYAEYGNGPSRGNVTHIPQHSKANNLSRQTLSTNSQSTNFQRSQVYGGFIGLLKDTLNLHMEACATAVLTYLQQSFVLTSLRHV